MTAPPPKQAPPLSIGDVVAEKYRIESLLGEGGMGFVFAALHLQLGHRVALKVLHTAQTSAPEITQRFLREGRALARLQSEHIARVSDVGTLPSREPYMVMEFLEGQDLSRELAARGPLPIVDVVDVVAQTCEALAEAHVRGIVHRDLKPANLFLTHKLDGDVCIKVLDFGISKVTEDGGTALEVDNITVTSTIVGTPKYMSPEQIQDSRSVDSRTDIWGLGTIFYELLTQKRPFAAPSLALVCVKVLHEEVPAPSTLRAEIPAGIDAIIARCLKKDPNERFANVGELVEALIPFGNPSVRSSVTRIQRILTADVRSSGPRLSSSDSSGSQPGVLNVPSSPQLADSGQPISRTPSAIRIDKDNLATLAHSQSIAVIARTQRNKTRRNVALAAAGALVVVGGIVFVATRGPSTDTHAATSAVASTETHPVVTATASTAPIASTEEPVASATASAAPSTHQHTGGHVANTHHVTSQPTATQTASPKGTGDVLEDRH
jgi:serine/threonine-protein kinase